MCKQFYLLSLGLILLSLFSKDGHAQVYTLSNDDVVVESGVLKSCSYDYGLKEIIIPDRLDDQDIISISNYVFMGKGLERIVLPSYIQSIGTSCFYNNALSSVSFANCTNLERIGAGAFQSNNIELVDLSSCVLLQNIGHRAFQSNNITSVELSSLPALTYIGECVFNANSSLTSFDLPSHVAGWKNVNGEQLTDDFTITDFTSYYYVPELYTLTNDDVVVENGVLKSCSYDFSCKEIRIPNELDDQVITSISNYVFMSKDLMSVTLPSNIESIGTSCFYNNSLSEISFANFSSLECIGSSAFQANNIESIDFTGCSALTTIKSSAFLSNDLLSVDFSQLTLLNFIGEKAFYSSGLSDFTLPYQSLGWKSSAGVLYIDGDLITNDLTSSYYIPELYTLTDDDVVVENGVLKSCSYDFSCKEISIPNELDDQVITSISNYVFMNKDLMSVTLPSNIESLGTSCFYNNSLSEISFANFSSLECIGSSAFHANNIESIDFTGCGALTTIKSTSFQSNNLTSLDLSPLTTLNFIGEKAFYNSGLSSFTLPDQSSGWESSAGLSYQDGNEGSKTNDLISSYYVPEQYTLTDDDVVVENGVLKSCSYDFSCKEISIPNELDDQVITSISNYVFMSKDLMSVTLPSNIESLGTSCFYNNSLSEISFANFSSLECIGSSAFQANNIESIDFTGCSALTTIKSTSFQSNNLIGLDLSPLTTLNFIGEKAFYNSGLSSFTLPDQSSGWESSVGLSYQDGNEGLNTNDLISSYYVPEQYTLTDDDVVVENGVLKSCSYDFSCKEIVIPNALDDQLVTSIANYVFMNKDLVSVILPNTLEQIGTSCFYNNALSEISFANFPSLECIGAGAFQSNELTNIDFTNCTALTSIKSSAFRTNNLISIDLSPLASLNFIGEGVFYSSGLSSFYLPSQTFDWVSSAGSVYETTDLKTNDLMSSYCMSGVYTLTDDDVVVEDGVLKSCSYDFSCKEIIISNILDGQTITAISNYVFMSKDLMSVSLPSNIVTIGTSCFYNNSLTEISFANFSSLECIGVGAFQSNDLTSIDFTGCTALTSIKSSAFQTNNLTSIDLSDLADLYFIGEQTFYNSGLSSFQLPSISYGWESSAGSIIVDGITNDLSSAYYVNETYTLTDDDVIVENGVLKSCSYDFICKQIIIPDVLDDQEVTSIGRYAFSSKDIVQVELPDALVAIESYAFYNNALTTVSFSNFYALETIGASAFQSNLITTVDFEECRSLHSIGASAFESNELIEVELEELIALTSIGARAFYQNSLIESLQLPTVKNFETIIWVDDYLNVFIHRDFVNRLYVGYTLLVSDLLVTVTDGTDIVVGAEVVIGDDTGVSNELGKIRFTNITSGTINYEASKHEYVTTTGSCSVNCGSQLSITLIAIDYDLNSWIGTAAVDETNWSNASNWSLGKVPTILTDVVIPSVEYLPVISSDCYATCHNLTIEADAWLTIQSDESNSGSLFIDGAVDGDGADQVKYERNVQTVNFQLLSSPLQKASISQFYTDNQDKIKTNGSLIAIAPYCNDVEEPCWGFYTDASGGQPVGDAGDFDLGAGYEMLARGEEDENGIESATANLTFTGTPYTGDLQYEVHDGQSLGSDFGDAWNLIGNPYTTALCIKGGDHSMLSTNADLLDEDHCAIYIWDSQLGKYSLVNFATSGNVCLAPGQAFFICDDLGKSDISFTREMQTADVQLNFKSAASTELFELNLQISDGQNDEYTRIVFNNDCTDGMDKGWDAARFPLSASSLMIYSQLASLESDGQMAVQCLPLGYNHVEIPIGVTARSGTEFSISSALTNLPLGSKVLLEDRGARVTVDLAKGTCQAIADEDQSDFGRFYLHVYSKVTDDVELENVVDVFPNYSEQVIHIACNSNNNDLKVRLIGLDGRVLHPTISEHTTIDMQLMPRGIYMVVIETQYGLFSKKILWK